MLFLKWRWGFFTCIRPQHFGETVEFVEKNNGETEEFGEINRGVSGILRNFDKTTVWDRISNHNIFTYGFKTCRAPKLILFTDERSKVMPQFILHTSFPRLFSKKFSPNTSRTST